MSVFLNNYLGVLYKIRQSVHFWSKFNILGNKLILIFTFVYFKHCILYCGSGELMVINKDDMEDLSKLCTVCPLCSVRCP